MPQLEAAMQEAAADASVRLAMHEYGCDRIAATVSNHLLDEQLTSAALVQGEKRAPTA